MHSAERNFISSLRTNETRDALAAASSRASEESADKSSILFYTSELEEMCVITALARQLYE